MRRKVPAGQPLGVEFGEHIGAKEGDSAAAGIEIVIEAPALDGAGTDPVREPTAGPLQGPPQR